MTVEFLAADVAIIEGEPSAITQPDIPTAIAGMVAVTQRGPFGRTLTTSWDEWAALYGQRVAISDGSLAAFGWYQNGGKQLFTVRTVHHTDISDPNSRTSVAASFTLTTTGAATAGLVTSSNAEPFNLEPGDTLDLKVDGGGTETATIDAAAASRSGSGGSFPTGFSGGETLTVEIDNDGVQTITFGAGDQTLVNIVNTVNAQLVGAFADDDGGELRITSDREGTASEVDVTGGTGAATLGMAVGVTAGTGDVADINAVLASELETIIEADTTAEVIVNPGGTITILTPTVGASGSIQVEASSTADTAIGLDNVVHAGTAAGPGDMGVVSALWDGLFGDSIDILIANASDGDSDRFNLVVKFNGVIKKTYANLSTVLLDERYWETLINTDTDTPLWITITDLLTGTPPTNRPTNGTFTLTGGNDGLVGLVDVDFIGDSAGPTGIRELDDVEDLTMLMVPGRATAAVAQAMVVYTETTRKGQVFAVLDSPAGLNAVQMRDYQLTTANLKGLSEFAAIYWPRIKVINPNEAEFTSDENGLITVPQSGHILGMFARTDASRPGGVHQPPAGIERGILFGVLDLESQEAFQKEKRDIVYPANVNPITKFSGVPLHVDGTRCLKTTGNWGTVGERRGVSFIEQQIKLLLAFVRHSNNVRSLRRRATRTAEIFLLGETEVGAFASEIPAEAFFVDFSDALNPPTVIRAKKLKGRIGLAKARPIDFATIEFVEDTRALDEELASQGLGG